MGVEVGDFAGDFTMLTIRRTITEISRKETGTSTPYQVKDRPKGAAPESHSSGPKLRRW